MLKRNNTKSLEYLFYFCRMKFSTICCQVVDLQLKSSTEPQKPSLFSYQTIKKDDENLNTSMATSFLRLHLIKVRINVVWACIYQNNLSYPILYKHGLNAIAMGAVFVGARSHMILGCNFMGVSTEGDNPGATVTPFGT